MAAEIKRCVIISGAPESDLSYYGRYMNTDFIICADSGYIKCKKIGAEPDLIIGDFDSSDLPGEGCEIIRLNVRKDETDTFECIKQAIERGFNDITLLGGIGTRIDHTYSNILSADYCFDRQVKCRLIDKHNHITIEQGSVELIKGDYKYFSLFALFGKCTGITIKGSQYDIELPELLPSSQLNQSNEFSADRVSITIKTGKIILILSND